MIRADKPMSALMKIAFWFVAVNALAGALSLILFPTHTDTLFFWTIRPAINAALFGALYLGGALIVAWVTYRGVWESARFLIPVLVSAGILISVTTLLHVDRFEPGFKLLYWLLIYIGAPLLALVFYVQHERGGANWAPTEPVTPATRSIAIALGSVLVLAGLALLIWPSPAVANWPWPTTPLMVRIFASWFGAFGVGLLWFRVEPDWRRLRHVANLMIAASGLDLLMVLVHRGDLTGGGVGLWVYCVHLAAFGLLGLVMHRLQRKGAKAVSTASPSPRPDPGSVDGPTREFLAWVARCPRTEADAMEAWRSTCPRYAIWEDALAAGLVRIDCRDGMRFGEARVALTPRGQAALAGP